MRERHATRGITLLETLLAVSLFITLAAGTAQLLAQTRVLAARADLESSAIVAAINRMERVRAVPWRFGLGGTSEEVGQLPVSPAGSLTEDVDGFHETLDEWGTPLTERSGEPRMVTRWAITPVAGGDDDARGIEVCVYAWPAGAGTPALVCLASARGRQP